MIHAMRTLVRTRATLVWLVLTLLTALSWYLAEDYGVHHALAVRWVTAALFMVAFVKVRLVIMHFMEINDAPIALRAVFEAWVLVVCGVLIALYLTGQPVAAGP